jgi:hypothetical protein
VQVTYDEDLCTPRKIKGAISEAGYTPKDNNRESKPFLTNLIFDFTEMDGYSGTYQLVSQDGKVLTQFETKLMILICPLMHLLMMKGLMGKGESCHGTKETNKTQEKTALLVNMLIEEERIKTSGYEVWFAGCISASYAGNIYECTFAD